MTNYCEYCGKGPFPTQSGLNKHIGQSNGCQGKNKLAFKTYSSTLWKNTPDATNDFRSSPSPPLDETVEDLEQDLLTVEPNISLDSTDKSLNLPNPETEHISQRNRATIEDVPGEEIGESGQFFEEYPTERKAGAAWGKDQPLFAQIQRDQQENGSSKWGPFEDQDEWELEEWLSKNVGQKQTDTFLKLNIVSTYTLTQCNGLSV